MKVRLALLDSDGTYLARIAMVFSTKYSDRLELYSFTEKETALAALAADKIDVFVAGETFDIDVGALPARCGFAYFVDATNVSTLNGHPAICKFQKADLIYKQILAIFSDHAGNICVSGSGEAGSTRVMVFSSPCGGTGTSSMAVACAMHLAKEGKRPFYLNLEEFGAAAFAFRGEGNFGMEDVVYAIKSKRANLQLKLESCVKQDACGVFFYDAAPLALDTIELTGEEIIELITALCATGQYSHIVIDMNFGLADEKMLVLHRADVLVWVSDGSETSRIKVTRAYEALATLEKNVDHPLLEKLYLLYNKFSNKIGKTVDLNIKSPGGVPKLEHATVQQVLEHLAVMKIFDSFV